MKVIVSSSSWNIVSGVPDALNLVVKLPADVPAKFLPRVAPIVPAVDPSSTIAVSYTHLTLPTKA